MPEAALGQLSSMDQPSERYIRHLALPDFSMESQHRLLRARILVVGAGGLGSPALLYLAAAGVGTIGIADPDRVSVSNLQRQVIFAETTVGTLKTDAAAEELQKRNSALQIRKHPVQITRDNARSILENYDLVIDATDNFPSRYLLNDACVLLGKTYIYGSVYQYEGQVSVFNHIGADGVRGPNYRDLFPAPPPPDQIPDCAEGGVLGTLPGIIGCVQANEAIKCITGIGEPLHARLWIIDTRTMLTRTMQLPKRSSHPIDSLIDYDQFCGTTIVDSGSAISPETLREWMRSSVPLRIIDLRTKEEREADYLESEHLPLPSFLEHIQSFDPSGGKVVFYCRSGQRSARALQAATREMPEGAFYHLKGGLIAWRQAGY